jgi:menaquinone-dependent protoporphyrinogen oxidase
MTNVLVASASRHGSTEEIARVIGDVLLAHGLSVDVKRMEDVDTTFPYETYVLGSAVYMGSWLRAAHHFVDRHAELIRTRPTWLFSSGPLGRPPHDAAGEPFDAADLIAETGARDHHLFGGRLDKERLTLPERAVAGLQRVPEGDYREWDAVAAWATAIARSLAVEAPA